LIAGVAAVVLAASAGVFYFVSRGDTASVAARPADEEAAQETAPPAPPAAAGFLAVDAAPWAEVGRVVDLDTGEEVGLTPDTTPCVLEVPPGRYRLVLHHPDFGDRTAQADVSSGSMTRVFETMPGFTAPLTPQRSDR
jgi:hypothetical protein